MFYTYVLDVYTTYVLSLLSAAISMSNIHTYLRLPALLTLCFLFMLDSFRYAVFSPRSLTLSLVSSHRSSWPFSTLPFPSTSSSACTRPGIMESYSSAACNGRQSLIPLSPPPRSRRFPLLPPSTDSPSAPGCLVPADDIDHRLWPRRTLVEPFTLRKKNPPFNVLTFHHRTVRLIDLLTFLFYSCLCLVFPFLFVV